MRKSSKIDLEALFDEIRALPPEWRDRIAETIAGYVEQMPRSAQPDTTRRSTDTGAQIIDLHDRIARRADAGTGDGEA